MPEAVNLADPRSEIRHIRFSKETLANIREFSRLWGNSSQGTTIALAFKLLKHLSDSGKLNAGLAPVLFSVEPSESDS